MSQATLEERVAALEQQMARLLTNGKRRKSKKDCLATFGMFADDPGFDEVLRLGREYRQQKVAKDNSHARS